MKIQTVLTSSTPSVPVKKYSWLDYLFHFRPTASVLFLILFLNSGCVLITPQFTDGYLFAYGVSEYGNIIEDGQENLIGPVPDLVSTDNDAADIFALFQNNGYEAMLRINGGGIYNQTDDESEAIETKPATYDQLLLDIAWVAERIKKDETVIFYFSGHGGALLSATGENVNDPVNPLFTNHSGVVAGEKQNDWFFLYTDDSFVSSDECPTTFLSDDTLGKILKEIPRGKLLVIFDSCNSGGFIGDSGYLDPVSDPYYQPDGNSYDLPTIPELISKYGADLSDYDVSPDVAMVLSAAGEIELSWESAGNGIFTSFLLQSRDNGDLNDDGIVSLFELYEYTSYKIENSWNEYRSSNQRYHPRISGSAIDFPIFQTD